MPKLKMSNTEILEAALVGLQQQLAGVDHKIADLRRRLGQRAASTTDGASSPAPRKGRRPLSAAARRRISAAQKERWAKFHKTRK